MRSLTLLLAFCGCQPGKSTPGSSAPQPDGLADTGSTSEGAPDSAGDSATDTALTLEDSGRPVSVEPDLPGAGRVPWDPLSGQIELLGA